MTDSQNTMIARSRVELAERIRSQVALAMHRESERDVDVAHDRLDLRIRAAVATAIDIELQQQCEWLRLAEDMDSKREAPPHE